MNAATAQARRRTGLTSRRFRLLLRKELMGLEGLFPLLLGATVLWELFLLSRAQIWRPEAVALASLLPLVVIPFWAAWAGFQSVRAEWNGDHAQLLLTLPVPYWQIQGVKLLAIWLQAGFTALVVGAAALLLGRGLIRDLQLSGLWDVVVTSVPTAAALWWLFIVHLSIAAQFASAVWRMVPRFGGLVALWATVMAAWLGDRLSRLLGHLFQWVPDLRLMAASMSGAGVQTVVTRHVIFIDSGPLLASLLLGLGLFWVGAILLERAADV